MNSAAEAVGFECPKGFSKEDVQSQLYFEDIDEDSELWLIRMPGDMDPNVLENQRISLDKSSEILSANEGKCYECFTEKCAMPNLCLVVPHKESKTLEEIKKPFKGSILITDYMLVDSDTLVKMEVEENGMEKENTVAEQQNGDSSVRKKSKSHKSSKEGKDKEDMELSFNLNIEDNHEGNSSQEKPSKKSKKKKSKDSDSLKVEPMSDADEFPNCKSQKM